VTESLKFSDALAQVDVEIGDFKYVLQEASGKVATAYRNAQIACTKLGENGKPSSINGIASTESLLVSLCLFRIHDKDGKSDLKPVSQAFVEGLSCRVQKALFEESKRISDLNESEPKEQQQLKRLFNRKDSPMPIESLREWVGDLGKDYAELSKWLEPSDEEKAKNEPSEITAG